MLFYFKRNPVKNQDIHILWIEFFWNSNPVSPVQIIVQVLQFQHLLGTLQQGKKVM